MHHFYDSLLNQDLNYASQIMGIEMLLHQTPFMCSPYEAISRCFLTWEKKRNYSCLQDLQIQTGIMDIINKANYDEEITKEEFIYYLEYVLLILGIPSKKAIESYVIMGYDSQPIADQVKFSIGSIIANRGVIQAGRRIIAGGSIEAAGSIHSAKSIESGKDIIAGSISAGWGLKANETIQARTYIHAETRIFAGMHLFHSDNEAHKTIRCAEIKGQICYGTLVLIEPNEKENANVYT